MRLEPEEIVAIKAAALRAFGDGVKGFYTAVASPINNVIVKG